MPLAGTCSRALPVTLVKLLMTPPVTTPSMVRPLWVSVAVEPPAIESTRKPVSESAPDVVPLREKIPTLWKLPVTCAVTLAKPGIWS